MQRQLNVSQAAELLGLSVHTIRAYVSQKRIPFRRIGARVVLDPDELQGWLEGKAVVPLVPHEQRKASGRAARVAVAGGAA